MLYFTVGPSQLFDGVENFITDALKEEIPSLSHRGEKFKYIFSETSLNLKKLLNIPENYSIVFVSSATEAMERIIQSVVEKESFHFLSGSFSKKFIDISKDYQKQTNAVELDYEQIIDLTNYEISETAEVICLTHNETSNGCMLDVKHIEEIKKNYPEKLIAVDIVSSVPFVNLDYRYIDIAFFSVQKGFGLPAGLGVMIISPQAFERARELKEKGVCIGSFHNIYELCLNAQKLQTTETPNVLNIYLLNKILEKMLRIGIDKIRQDTDKKAELFYDFFDNSKYKPNISVRENRSKTVIVVNTDGDTKKIMAKLKNNGIIVGEGYGQNKDTQIRIANFPVHKIRDVKDLIQCFNP